MRNTSELQERLQKEISERDDLVSRRNAELNSLLQIKLSAGTYAACINAIDDYYRERIALKQIDIDWLEYMLA